MTDVLCLSFASHVFTKHDHFHVKLLILSFSLPPPSNLFSLLAFSQNTAHVALIMHFFFIIFPAKSRCATHCKQVIRYSPHAPKIVV